MPFKDPDARRAYQRQRYAMGRPRSIEGESMVVSNSMLASMVEPSKGGVYFLSVDEIIKRKGWGIYKEMLHDDQVKSCLEFKKVLVTGRTWEIMPGDDSEEAKTQAKFVEDAMERFEAKDAMRAALTGFEFGYSLAEQVFERDTWDEDGQQYIFLKKLPHRDPQDLLLKIDRHGNFLGVKQQNFNQIVELDPPKVWLFTHDERFGNLYGNSDLRAAYRPWFCKKFITQFWNVFLERFGAPMTKVTYPQGASEELKNNLKTILSNLASKTEVLVPEGVTIDLIEATRGGNSGYMEALSFHNNAIARAILMVGLMGGADGDKSNTSPSGTQGYLSLRVLFKVADEISKRLSCSLMKQVICPLLDMNFENPIYPTFVWQDYGQFEGMQIADEIRQLHAAGIIDMDQADVNYVRSVLGLPIREEDKPDEVIRPAPTPPPGGGVGQPPAPETGNTRAVKPDAQRGGGGGPARAPKGSTNDA